MNFPQIFKKTLSTEHPQVTAPADSSVPTKVLSIDHTLFIFFPLFFCFIVDNFNYGSLLRKCKNEDFLTFYINVVKVVLAQQLPTHIKENTDFLWQKS